MPEGYVSEDLFRRQLDVTDRLSQTMVQVVEVQKGMMHILEELRTTAREEHDRIAEERSEAVEEVKKHISLEHKAMESNLETKLEFWKKPAYWLSIALLAGSAALGVILKVIGFIK